MRCQSCGANIYDDVNRCQYCGAYQTPKAQPAQATPLQAVPGGQQPQTVIYNVIQQPAATVAAAQDLSVKNRWVACILCLIGGVIGLHKFYLGKVGAGILYLFTFGLFGVGWLLDLIFIVCGTATDKWGRKLKS